MIPFFKEDRQ